MNICSKTFRKTLSAFPTGVTIVTTHSPDKAHIGLTISSFTSVSLAPPQILFCLTNSSSVVDFFKPGHPFAVNVLSSHQTELSDHFASGMPTDWKTLSCHPHPSSDCMLLNGCMGHVICEVADVHTGGDHTVIVGKVTDLIRCEEQNEPLVRHLSEYKSTKSLR